MFHATKLKFAVLAALVVGAVGASATTAQAQTGRRGRIYSATLYYKHNGQWRQYGRYFVTVYANRRVDWGGIDRAYKYLRSRGYRQHSTMTWRYKFWRVTNNG